MNGAVAHIPRSGDPAAAHSLNGINLSPGSTDDGWMPPYSVILRDGSHVQLYKDGEALHAAFEAIRHARKRVGLEVYIFRSDPTGRAFAELLAAKAKSGVPVYLIYDSFGCMETDEGVFKLMSRAGVRMAEFHPMRPWDCRYSWRPANRDHRKLLVIDDHLAGLGGLNIGDEYAGSWVSRRKPVREPWRDNALGIRGPLASLFQVIFASAWRYAVSAGRLRRMEFIHNAYSGEVGVLATVPSRRSPAATLIHMLHDATTSVYITMSYFAPPDDLIEALCVAAGRGVRVRLMFPGRTDVKLLLVAQQSFYERLLSAGAEVYERQGVILHAKTTCIDGRTVVLGSTNLDYRSIEYNCELAVVIRNSTLGSQMHDLFENDVRYSRRLALKEWRRRPVHDRVVQWAVMRARYLL
ncbi:MAG: phospholipase D-like domain-containing protein [Tepidisphaeraceae bacterium]|jgi:cardiolipin synthase